MVELKCNVSLTHYLKTTPENIDVGKGRSHAATGMCYHLVCNWTGAMRTIQCFLRYSRYYDNFLQTLQLLSPSNHWYSFDLRHVHRHGSNSGYLHSSNILVLFYKPFCDGMGFSLLPTSNVSGGDGSRIYYTCPNFAYSATNFILEDEEQAE